MLIDSNALQAKVATSISIFSGAGLVLDSMGDFLNHNAAAIGAVCCIVSTISALHIRYRKPSK
jgi:hypothetical protein